MTTNQKSQEIRASDISRVGLLLLFAGGGDTVTAIAKYGIESQVDYISTGGGAFLEVLEGKTLPAFEILQKRAAG